MVRGYTILLLVLGLDQLTCELIFISSPKTQVATFGEDVSFDCIASDSTVPGRNLTYAWFLDAGSIPSKSLVFSNHSLLIPDLQQEDVGNYTCVVYTSAGAPLAVSQSATIIPAYINGFLQSPSSVSVIEGETISLECVTGESAPPAQIYWERNLTTFTEGSQYNTTFQTSNYPDLIKKTSMKLVIVARPSHTGIYNCMAKNYALNTEVRSLQVSVVVQALERAPFLNVTLYQRNVLAPLSSNHMINCPVSGYPQPTVTWFKDNKRLSLDDALQYSNGSLQLYSLSKRLEGYFYCKAQNKLGNFTSPEIILQLTYIGLDFEREPHPVFVVAGQPVTMPCSPPISFPSANVTWYRNNQPLNITSSSQSLIIVDAPNGVWDLFIPSVQKQHEGEYFCVAINNLAIPMSRTSAVATLKVGGSPIFISPPVNHRVIKGQGLQLRCIVEGDPTPNIEWFLNSIPLDEGAKVNSRLGNQELYIRDIDKGFEGTFTCKATNIYGTAETSAKVVVVVPPVITDPLPGGNSILYKPTAGQNITIKCVTYGDPVPNITWYKENILLEFGQRFSSTSEGLLIQNVSAADSGQYKCLVINEGGSAQAQGKLQVQVLPYFVKVSNDTAVVIGQSFTLECHVNAVPEAVINWLYNSTFDLPMGSFLSSDHQTVTVSMTTWHHVGLYTCIASNSVGSNSTAIKVSLRISPNITVIVGDTVVYLNKDTELTCAVGGIPYPEISWYRHGNLVTSSLDGRIAVTRSKTLLMRFVQPEDAGEYSCRAVNEVGVAEKSVSLYIIEPPLPPLLLTPITRSSSSVTMTWTPATQRPQTIVDKYSIYFKTREAFAYQKYPVDIKFGSLSYDVDNLQPGTEYLFKMTATNKAGEGRKSNSKSSKTFDSGPSQPRNVMIISVSASSIQVQWEVPITTNGIIRKYRVWYKLQSDTGTAMQSIDLVASTPTMSYHVPNLKPYSNYEFSVQAATIQDDVDMWGQLSPNVASRTRIGVPASSPTNITVTVLSSSEIQVKWQSVVPENQNGPITVYHVRYKSMSGSSYLTKKITGTTSCNITDLLPWRMYEVSMAAATEAGVGPYSESFTVRTLPTAPSASPLNVTLTSIASQAIQVYFQLPSNETWNSELSGCTVRARQLGHEYLRVFKMKGIEVRIFNISDLEPWTEYDVSIALYTDQVTDGVGPFSDWKIIRTLESAPAQIGDVVSQVTPTSMTLSWQPPDITNGIILGYFITYWTVREDHVSMTTSSGLMSSSTTDTFDRTKKESAFNISTKDTTILLSELTPSTKYNISITASTSAGQGPEKYVTVQTGDVPSRPSLPSTEEATTSEAAMTITAALYQKQNGDDSPMLPAILAGCAAGIMLILLIVVLIICVCLNKTEKDQQALYVENTDIDGIGVDDEDSATSGSSTKVVESKAVSHTDNKSLAEVDLRSNSAKYNIHHVNPSQYGDMRDSQSMVNPGAASNMGLSPGIENPGYGEGYMINQDLESMAVSLDLSTEEMYSEASTTLKRKSRMKNESAAAIAALKNKNLLHSLPSVGDRDSLINNDTVVVYAERTAL